MAALADSLPAGSGPPGGAPPPAAAGRGAAARSPILPRDHPRRRELNDEVHARPPEPMVAPARISFLALLSPWGARDGERERVGELARRLGAPEPEPGATHYRGDLGAFRLKWERHTEFTRYKFIATGAGDGDGPFDPPALAAVPADWLAGLPGEVMVATHAALLPAGGADPPDHEALAARLFAGHPLVGATVGGGAAAAFTDFRIHADGFGRLLVLDRGLTPRQAGRTVQRLLEVDTYRVMALMALPLARALVPFLAAAERELAGITAALAAATEADEPVLLDRLTRLEAEIARSQSDNHTRFGAATAYHDLVRRRIGELREGRIAGLQGFDEFIERRLGPAIQTCRTAAERQDGLSRQVARATQLLSTRVELTRERQTQAVLETMNRRARLQLRLQQTVEGLSVVAVTYYVAGLLGYLAKGLAAAGALPVDPDLLVAAGIPVAALLMGLGVRRIRRVVSRASAAAPFGPRP